MARLTSRLSAGERIAHYSPTPEDDYDEDYDGGYVPMPAPARLTPAQRRRTVHKAQGDEHEDLADPDRWQKAGRKQAYLSPDQFMKMSEVKKLPSVDMHGGPVSRLIPYKHSEIATGEGNTADYDLLREAMRKGGPTGREVPPVHIASGQVIHQRYGSTWADDTPLAFGNGGHRIALADELGWKMVPYTRDANRSGYGDYRGFNKDDDDEYESSSGYNIDSGSSSYHLARSQKATTTGDISDIGREPSTTALRYARGARSYVPGHTGEAMPGNRWHARGKDGSRTTGLYTQLHGRGRAPGASQPLTLNDQQFALTRAGAGPIEREAAAAQNARKYAQDVLPGLNHYGSQYGGHEWSAGNASEGNNWPGGGRIHHSDMYTSW